jgi:riboflavin biosynthesis pyrimidine reductase
VEGGAELAASLLPLADELFWFSSPINIGSDGVPAFAPLDSGKAEKLPMPLVESRFFRDNILRYFSC